MLNKEMTEMNYIRKISIETSAPEEPGLFNLHFGICGHAGNVLAELPAMCRRYIRKNAQQEDG